MAKLPDNDAPRTGLRDPLLWSRIHIAPLPTTRDGADFAHAIARVDDLPLADAREVEGEYRRFLYLCAISEEPRVPPPQLRLAWRLHAQSPEYTAFCAGVLGKPLSLEETARMLGATSAYRQTCAAYAREFGEAPPPVVWSSGVQPRLPRWLTIHAVIFGFLGMVAWGQGQPLYLAAALALSLAVYGLDLVLAHRARVRGGFGDSASEDLRYWLGRQPGE